MKKWFNYTIFFLNLFALFGILFSLISPFINPNIFWPISFFGLFFPVFIIILFAFSIFWFFHNRKYMWFNLVFLIFSIPYIGRFISINSSNITGEEVNIMSYNVRFFDKTVLVSVSEGKIFEQLGANVTSSKVRASFMGSIIMYISFFKN